MRLASKARMNPSTSGFQMKSFVFGRSKSTHAGISRNPLEAKPLVFETRGQ